MSIVTAKQRMIMAVIMQGNVNTEKVTTSWCDIAQIRDRLPYEATREAILCSIKFLEKKKLVEVRPRAVTRRQRRRTLYLPTDYAFDSLTKKPETVKDITSI